eukprot:INCI17637.4.p1 GENE.INCI17637.4~~INCI17637.4.p1  ORF type:complete len:422 (+),score=50.32 INCI17637.4:930-2195(+)
MVRGKKKKKNLSNGPRILTMSVLVARLTRCSGLFVYGLATEPFQLSADACSTHYQCSSDPANTTVITNTTCTTKISAERFADAIYFATVTLTTVGYGDLVPQGDGIRLFTVFYALLAVGIIGPAVGVLLDTCAALRYRTRKSVYKRDTLRLRHKKKLQRCCSEALPFIIFGIATLVGVVYFFVEDMRQPGFETGDAIVHAFYYTIVTSTTIGYGDYSPHSVAGRIIACAYLLGATIIIAVLFDKLSSYMVDARVEKRRNQALESYGKGLDKGELSDIVKETCTMFSDDGKACSKAEFTIFMAMRGGLIDREDVDDCIDAFDKLDQNHSGTLTIEDCYFIPDRVAQLGRNKVLAELSKLESALNDSPFPFKDTTPVADGRRKQTQSSLEQQTPPASASVNRISMQQLNSPRVKMLDALHAST